MTNRGSDDRRLGTNQRRKAAREKARGIREQQKKKDRLGRLVLLGGITVVSLAIIATVTLILVNSIQPPAPGPRNMLSDGITIGQNFEAVSTPALQADEEPVEPSADPEGDSIAIEIYVDYLCPACAMFEETNSERISTLLEQGVATIEIHPVAINDGLSVNTQYSSRAANAAACVANFSPNSFYGFHALMFENQPDEQEPGLTDEELVDITRDAEVSNAADIEGCITEQSFEKWVEDATVRATADRALQGDEGQFGLPLVLVNGERFQGAPDDETAFTQFTAVADAAAFSEKSSASPSPSPEPAPAP